MKTLKNKNILLCITGSIAAYKSCEILRELRKNGVNVQVMMSKTAEKFIGRATMAALSNNTVITDLFDNDSTKNIQHVKLSFEIDAIVIAPATANIICKASKGIADDTISTTLSISDVPVLFAPAMNFRMWNNQATIEAIRTLEKRGHYIVDPEKGALASLHKGQGRLASTKKIFNQIKKMFNYDLILENKNILITAGPTQEYIDPVRYISNKSSGKMGYAIAEAAKYYGGNVTLVSGPVSIEKISGIDIVDIVTAQDLKQAVNKLISNKKFDMLFMVAAVADYTPKKNSKNKIKSNNRKLNLELINTADILESIKDYKTLKIGFALETNNGEKNAIEKLDRKRLDYILLNYANEEKAGFDSDFNHLYLYSSKGFKREFKLDSKERLAKNIILTIINNENK